MWLWAQSSAMKKRAAELRYAITDPPKIEEPANRQVSTHGSIQTKPSLYRTHNYMDAGILASGCNEPPWVIIISRIFRFTSNSKTISWKPKDRKWTPEKPNKRRLWIEHKADQTHSTLTTSTNIFTPRSLWRAGTTTYKLHHRARSKFCLQLHYIFKGIWQIKHQWN